MHAHDRLRNLIDNEGGRLRADIPSDREAAIVALVRAQDRLAAAIPTYPASDLITGRRLPNLGGGIALRLCLEAAGAATVTPADIDRWADAFLAHCERVARAKLVLGHGETGFMRIVDREDGSVDAWIASARPPVSWRERADIDWWADHLARTSGSEDAAGRVDRMAYQLGYPDDAVLGGVPVSMWRRVVTCLIERAARAMGIDHTTPVYRRNALATDLGLDPDVAVSMIDALTLDAGNAGWYASVPGVAAPPLVRIDAERVALSWHGLTSEPFFFLTRGLRRRDAQDYHNSASLREDVFRQELYRLFTDKRFVHSEGRIVLRRADGKARTDIDAAVFDRKTGALGLFELKSQDPFARSAAELTRQGDNLLYANRQVSGTLDWLNRHGADEVLNRIDRQTAKRFRVRKVHPFVLGRFLAHFNDGQAPDRRAAWATWPQVLRLAGGEPFGSKDSNPIAALFAGIGADLVDTGVPAAMEAMELAIGDAQVRVFPSYAAYRARSV